MGVLVEDVAAALDAAGLTQSRVLWDAANIPATGALEYIVQVQAGDGGGVIGDNIATDTHALVVSSLVGGGAMTPTARHAAALDRVSLVRRTLDTISQGTARWTQIRFTRYTISDVDSTWLRVDCELVMVAAFDYSTAT